MKLEAFLVVLAIGCTALLLAPPDVPASIPGDGPLLCDELRDAVEANRRAAGVREDREVEDLLYPYTHFADDETITQIAYSDDNPRRTVSLAEAREDVVFLFEMFKYGYCMYEAFGGDGRFGEEQEAILDELEGSLTGTSVRVADLKALILRHLRFIQDGHAAFAGTPLYQRQRWFRNNRYEFRKDDVGYYVVKKPLSLRALFAGGTERIRLTSVDGEPPDEYLALSLSAGGELVYILSRLSSQQSSRLPVHTVFEMDGWTAERTTTLHRQSGSPLQEALRNILFDAGVTYDLRFEGDISVVVNRSTIPAPASAVEELEQFIAGAATISEAPVAILDLRNHGGGQAEYPLEWTKAFTGHDFVRDRLWIELQTRVSLRLHQYFARWYYTGNPERAAIAETYFDEMITYVDTDPAAPENAWHISSKLNQEVELMPNDTVLFVLVDAETGSAGEEFVEILRLFENVILVGENTEGLTISGSPGWGILPHSGLPFTVTIGMSAEDVLAGREGIGALPDIWVDPRLALNRVLEFIQSR